MSDEKSGENSSQPKVLILDPSRGATCILTRKLTELQRQVEFDGIAGRTGGIKRVIDAVQSNPIRRAAG